VKAWQVRRLGAPADALELVDVPDPVPGPLELLVRVEACALNFPDVLMCAGLYQEKPELPFTPGLEVCGTVVDVGRVGQYLIGSRVIGGPTLPHGGLAELAVLPVEGIFGPPEGMPADEAAALMITYQTAWVGLHRRAHLQAGEWLLVHAGAGGVGSAAIQVGLAAGARVIASAGGPEKTAVCRELGAHEVIDYRDEDVVARVKEITGGHGADVIWDPVGGDVFDASRRCIAFEGRLVVVGFTAGRIPTVPAGHVLVKNYSVVGLHWGLYRTMDPPVIAAAHAALTELYAAGKIKPLVSERVPMAGAPAALTRLAARGTVGKLVVLPWA
jgi:NADPH:quinone reductase